MGLLPVAKTGLHGLYFVLIDVGLYATLGSITIHGHRQGLGNDFFLGGGEMLICLVIAKI